MKQCSVHEPGIQPPTLALNCLSSKERERQAKCHRNDSFAVESAYAKRYLAFGIAIAAYFRN
jgi:hypothetical protein